MLPFKIKMIAAVVLATWFYSAAAFWRLPCPRQIGLARVDPLVAAGAISDHAHTIAGGNNFGCHTTSDDLMMSNCTSCAIDKDRSVYWTPILYFHHANGTFEKVTQVGGMLVYYFNNNGAPGEKITAFPKGFSMISGDTRQRNFTLPMPVPPKSFWKAEDMTQLALAQKSLGYNCLHYSHGDEEALNRFFLPDKSFIDTCYSGLRLEVQFPSCWNGKDVDSPNHKDHVKFPNLVKTGECPEGFHVRLPVLFYETIYAVADFIKYDGEYVLSNGDPTGYGYHGDFINGWDVDFLQEALDVCTDETNGGEVEDCPVFAGHVQREAPDDCKFPLPEKIAHESYLGLLDSLPGNVSIQPGPEYGPKPKNTPLVDDSIIATTATPSAVGAPSPAPSAASPSGSETQGGLFTTTYAVATSTYVENGEEIHLVIIQEDVVVAQTVFVAAKKRHVHGHGRHGGDGR